VPEEVRAKAEAEVRRRYSTIDRAALPARMAEGEDDDGIRTITVSVSSDAPLRRGQNKWAVD